MPLDGTHHEVIEDLEHEVAMRLQARALKDESFEDIFGSRSGSHGDARHSTLRDAR